MTEQKTFNALTSIRYRRMLVDYAHNNSDLAYSIIIKMTNLQLEDHIEKLDGSLLPMLEHYNINTELPK